MVRTFVILTFQRNYHAAGQGKRQHGAARAAKYMASKPGQATK